MIYEESAGHLIERGGELKINGVVNLSAMLLYSLNLPDGGKLFEWIIITE
jgi:hypothetical protein